MIEPVIEATDWVLSPRRGDKTKRWNQVVCRPPKAKLICQTPVLPDPFSKRSSLKHCP